ncbi:disease resistance protein RPM1-like [Lolium rigidum]|uniref:disease resistance protein RPM1-like n=1 Tax=Lolium rigidum TaxID=89674 RepID=UPI001F5C0ECA|nr:disease resistance protein RPM1-like [Lolium rigidum]XP_047058610.1 disease resistance protein RPM1-like [Lolium rigidum]XP_047058611.1 disease resistance protein RPM1-like [Lolium rigidum]XP_047058612.1 disease resistance protein RPM1-like [Lolium rigidum]XP_047058613.1 disease resistance protein RPM1-like [Lolium rigidum]
MAEAVVGQLVVKLGAALVKEAATFGGSLLFKEASTLRVLFGKIRMAKAELESMQAYLQEAERFKDTDRTTTIFVREIRGLAFQIEDVVDEFTYKLEEVKHGGYAAKMKNRLKHIKTWRRMASKLQKVEDKLQDAKQRKKDYTVIAGIDRFTSAIRSMNQGQALHFTRDEDLVGVEENRDMLIRWLTGGGGGGGGDDSEQRSSKVTTVWGMPGVGKTTLVAHVYSTVKVDFDAAAWVTVSESYRIEDLLKKIATEFGITVNAANNEMRGLAESIHNYLQGKKYILVLDDVWTARCWSEIKNIFPTSNCTGRFVITSRKHEVSLLATRESAIHLEPLQAHHSWLLFCKGAFWNDDDKECPLELQNLALMFIAKCQGLPIALACIGRLLSCKPPTSAEWENVYMGLDLQLVTDVIPDAHMVLKVSLEDLPYGLKNCFLHCALFPEDYVLKRRTILRQWIAAGFIREKENRTLEEVAEGYLMELVNRSLLQVVRRNHAGRLKHCRMHDIIRLLALNKAKEECFGDVYNGSAAGTRRLSIHVKNFEQLSRSGATHLRALHVFERYINVDFLKPILTSSNLLSTLDLQGTNIKMLPNEVFDLFNLRYLGLRCTDIESLPEAVGRLQNLEVLDASDTKLTYLPNNVVKLQKLRYLYAHTATGALEALENFSGGVKVPNGIQHLAGLQALQCVKATPEFLHEVGALIELRTFDVCNVQSENSTDLGNAIAKMIHLVHLEIGTAAKSDVLQLEGLSLPPTLSWLGLVGQLDKTSMPQLFTSWSLLNSLTRLHLVFSNIDEESFSCLCVLHGLRSLELVKAFEGKRLDFYAGSFPQLRFLRIWCAAKLNQIGIEDSAMQNLVMLSVVYCSELKVLPDGIEHLRALEKLRLVDTSEELVEKLLQNRDSDECSEDLMKISHIRNVTVELTRTGLLERIR